MRGNSKLKFDGIDILAAQIDRVGGDLRKATEEALIETAKVVERNTREAALPYIGRKTSPRGYSTGSMFKTIISDHQVDWNGWKANIHTGFKIKDAGIHSIFLTRGNGTAKMQKDRKLVRALMGTETKREIQDKQEEIFKKYVAIGKETK